MTARRLVPRSSFLPESIPFASMQRLSGLDALPLEDHGTVVTVGFFAWVELLFPAWVLVLSLYVLISGFRRGRMEGPSGASESSNAA